MMTTTKTINRKVKPVVKVMPVVKVQPVVKVKKVEVGQTWLDPEAEIVVKKGK